MDYTIQTRLHDDVLEIELSGKGGAHNADEIAQDVFKSFEPPRWSKCSSTSANSKAG